MSALEVQIWERGNQVKAVIRGGGRQMTIVKKRRYPPARAIAPRWAELENATAPELRIKGRTMADWMEMFARDDEFIAGIEAVRAEQQLRWRASMEPHWRQARKPVASVPGAPVVSAGPVLMPEAAARIDRMLALAGIARAS